MIPGRTMSCDIGVFLKSCLRVYDYLIPIPASPYMYSYTLLLRHFQSCTRTLHVCAAHPRSTPGYSLTKPRTPSLQPGKAQNAQPLRARKCRTTTPSRTRPLARPCSDTASVGVHAWWPCWHPRVLSGEQPWATGAIDATCTGTIDDIGAIDRRS